MTVGCGSLQHRLVLILHVQENAIEIIARFLGRNREFGLVDNLDQRGGGQLKRGRQITFGNNREVIAGQRLQVEPRASSVDLHLAIGGVHLHLRAIGQFAGDIEQGMRGDSNRTGGFHLCLNRIDNLQSRSVAISLMLPSSAASISTLDRIGMVLRRSTTDWTWPRLLSSAARSMVAFINDPLLPRWP